jgi:FkbM family methyltransferase
MPLEQIPLRRPNGDLQIKFELDPDRPNEKTVLSFLRNGRFYEQDIAAIFLRAIQPGDTVLDIGANVGIFSVLAGLLAGSEGRVVGFEPVADNRTRLAANLALNDVTNVEIVAQPASDRVEDAMFHLNSDSDGGHSLWDPGNFPPNRQSRDNPRPTVTRTTTIDAEVARLGLAPPRLIKIDTEGAEHRVLSGAINLLREFEIPYIIAELHEFGLNQMGSSQSALRGFMAELGYETFLLYEDGSLPKLVPRRTMVASKYFLNLLFSTPEDVGALWRVENFDPYIPLPGE